MKRILLATLILLASTSAFAQDDMYGSLDDDINIPSDTSKDNSSKYLFRMIEGGYFVSNDGKEYIVIPYEGKSAQALYNRIKSNVTMLYNSAKDVISTSENSVISIKGYEKNAGYRPVAGFGYNVYFDISYVLKFMFKDGKIRIDAPTILSVYADNELMPEYHLWCKNQKLFVKGQRNPKRLCITEGFEKVLNGIIESILKYDETTEDW
ncbi:MAG: DUF4468 domain-containing protein [Prevotella sp.]|nr:DUF4468 domain-containing protein [Prevotella sp.]